MSFLFESFAMALAKDLIGQRDRIILENIPHVKGGMSHAEKLANLSMAQYPDGVLEVRFKKKPFIQFNPVEYETTQGEGQGSFSGGVHLRGSQQYRLIDWEDDE